ncbi:MAG: DNA polymerase III subunit delta [Sphingomonadales bacterium]|nr:DNA polymerase III subunit delta [Sphingomonadales bacterium]
MTATRHGFRKSPERRELSRIRRQIHRPGPPVWARCRARFRARHRLAQRLAQSEDPPGEIVRVDDADLEQNPDHLSIELLTMPMFGGRKIVRAIAGRRINTAQLKPLVDGPALTGSLIVEAGDLKPTDGLRALFDKSTIGVAIPCYADEARDLSGMIAEVLEAAKLTISPEAQQQLMARLGADRALSRSEVDKLALYAARKDTIDIDDVEAVVGDAAELAMDRVVNAAALGQGARALIECDRAFAAGENPQSLIAATQRHLTRLHRTRTALESGRSLDEVIRNMRPPLHFKQRQAFETQCRQCRPAASTGLSPALPPPPNLRASMPRSKLCLPNGSCSMSRHWPRMPTWRGAGVSQKHGRPRIL